MALTVSTVSEFTKQFHNNWPDVTTIQRIWQRLPQRSADVDLEETAHSKPYILAILYMLHLEHYHMSERPSGCESQEDEKVTNERANVLTGFDLWIRCCCQKQCVKQWNFVNKVGIYRPPDEQNPQCKAVKAWKGMTDSKCLRHMYQEWKDHK